MRSYFNTAALAAQSDGEPLDILELEANLADIEKPPELPAGLYNAEIQDVQIPTSSKGNRYYAIKFAIAAEEIPADVAEHFEDGAVLFYNRLVVPTGKDRRALYNLRQFIESIGLDSNTTTIDPNEWMGTTARLKVRQVKYQGEWKAEIQSVEQAAVDPTPARGSTRRAPEPIEEEVDEAPTPRGRRAAPAKPTARGRR